MIRKSVIRMNTHMSMSMNITMMGKSIFMNMSMFIVTNILIHSKMMKSLLKGLIVKVKSPVIMDHTCMSTLCMRRNHMNMNIINLYVVCRDKKSPNRNPGSLSNGYR